MQAVFCDLTGFLIFYALFEIGLSITSNCTKCDSYLCFEEKHKCGPKGYFAGFAYPNCRRFNDPVTIDRLTPSGRVWSNCTMHCLLNSMQSYLTNEPTITCDRIKTVAFAAHVPCYLECDFCKICKTNKWALARTYNYGDFLSFAVLKQVLSIAKSCGLFTCFI